MQVLYHKHVTKSAAEIEELKKKAPRVKWVSGFVGLGFPTCEEGWCARKLDRIIVSPR